MDNVEHFIKNMIARQFNKNIEDILGDLNFIEDLGADSIDLVELVMACEDEFKIDLPVEDAVDITTVDEMIKFVHHELNKKS